MAKKEERHREVFWLKKKVCEEFESMGPPIMPPASRKPLLKDVDFFSGQWRR
jgi:hypothetical protein